MFGNSHIQIPVYDRAEVQKLERINAQLGAEKEKLSRETKKFSADEIDPLQKKITKLENDIYFLKKDPNKSTENAAKIVAAQKEAEELRRRIRMIWRPLNERENRLIHEMNEIKNKIHALTFFEDKPLKKLLTDLKKTHFPNAVGISCLINLLENKIIIRLEDSNPASQQIAEKEFFSNMFSQHRINVGIRKLLVKASVLEVSFAVADRSKLFTALENAHQLYQERQKIKQQEEEKAAYPGLVSEDPLLPNVINQLIKMYNLALRDLSGKWQSDMSLVRSLTPNVATSTITEPHIRFWVSADIEAKGDLKSLIFKQLKKEGFLLHESDKYFYEKPGSVFCAINTNLLKNFSEERSAQFLASLKTGFDKFGSEAHAFRQKVLKDLKSLLNLPGMDTVTYGNFQVEKSSIQLIVGIYTKNGAKYCSILKDSIEKSDGIAADSAVDDSLELIISYPNHSFDEFINRARSKIEAFLNAQKDQQSVPKQDAKNDESELGIENEAALLRASNRAGLFQREQEQVLRNGQQSVPDNAGKKPPSPYSRE